MDADRLLAAAEPHTTPLAAVDVERMEANLAAMRVLAEELGVRLRPHAKTHKSAFVARRQLANGAAGLTAATLREAELFAEAGAADLLIAHPPVGAPKLARLAALAGRVPRVAVSLDSVEVASALPHRVDVLWEVDTGHHRVGTAPGAATVAAVRDLVAVVGPERFRGLLTFPGHAYAASAPAELSRTAEAESRAMLGTAALLEEAGIAVCELSVGSTPTARWTVRLGTPRVPGRPGGTGLTEMRPGSYVYGDAQQVALGAMAPEECALAVVATVVSTPAAERAVVDAGSKAVGTDRSVPWLQGLGSVAGRDDLILDRVSEEHGVLLGSAGAPTRLRIGERVLIVPAHCCTTVNLHPELLMVEAGESGWDPVGARGWGPGVGLPGAAEFDLRRSSRGDR
jgi:D-serine deaminase-like pyridoxal phosphate-dependent protein